MRDHRTASGRLAKDRHIVRVTTEIPDILLYPFHGSDLIQHSIISGNMLLIFFRKLRMGKEAEVIHPVIDRDKDHSFLTEGLPVKLHLVSVSRSQTTAVDPEHDRKLFISALGRCPHIQLQTIITCRHLYRIKLLSEEIRKGHPERSSLLHTDL